MLMVAADLSVNQSTPTAFADRAIAAVCMRKINRTVKRQVCIEILFVVKRQKPAVHPGQELNDLQPRVVISF